MVHLITAKYTTVSDLYHCTGSFILFYKVCTKPTFLFMYILQITNEKIILKVYRKFLNKEILLSKLVRRRVNEGFV